MIPEIMHSNVLCLTIESQPECPDFRRQFHVTIKQRLAVHAEGKIVTRPFFGRLVHQKFRRKPATTKKKFRRKISRWGCGETTWEGRRATKPRVMGGFCCFTCWTRNRGCARPPQQGRLEGGRLHGRFSPSVRRNQSQLEHGKLRQLELEFQFFCLVLPIMQVSSQALSQL